MHMVEVLVVTVSWTRTSLDLVRLHVEAEITCQFKSSKSTNYD